MRDFDLGGVYVPALIPIFSACVAVLWFLDRILAASGFYGHVWHPALFRASVFACVFGGAALLVYN